MKLKKDYCSVINIALFIITLVFGTIAIKRTNNTRDIIENIEYVDSTNTFNKIYYDTKISNLKKKNKELYDSLKTCRDQITYLVQFKYEKTYSTGKVSTKEKPKQTVKPIEVDTTSTTYEYSNSEKDTLNYRLKINSQKEPNWYSLDVTVSDKFTIVNKSDGEGMNMISIHGENEGNVSDVTVFKKKDKSYRLKDHIYTGPTVTAGYDMLNNNFGVMVGWSVGYKF